MSRPAGAIAHVAQRLDINRETLRNRVLCRHRHKQDLRHTHATLFLKAGVKPKVLSERLGHSSVAFTLDTYAHVIPGMQEAAADLFGAMLFDRPGRVSGALVI